MRFLYYITLFSFGLTMTGCVCQRDEDQCVVDQTYVHKYGVEVPSDYWESTGEEGSVITTMADGSVITRGYSGGMPHGDTTYSYPHSLQVARKEVFSTGALSKEGEYYFDGTPKNETVYNSPEPGMKTVSAWYLTGTPKSVEQYNNAGLLVKGEYYSSFHQLDAKVDNSEGIRLVRDDYGQLISTDKVQGGQLVSRTTYHPNGSPREVVAIKDGRVDGIKRTFYPGGEPNTNEQWSMGKQHGITTVYHHGEKYADVPYVNGAQNGVEKRYRDGKEVVQEISWSNGLQNGPTTTYVGDTSKTEWYYQGNLTSKTDYDFMVNKPVVR